MKFRCPYCNRLLRGDVSMAGKSARCPGCSGRVHVPDSLPSRTPKVPDKHAGAVVPPPLPEPTKAPSRDDVPVGAEPIQQQLSSDDLSAIVPPPLPLPLANDDFALTVLGTPQEHASEDEPTPTFVDLGSDGGIRVRFCTLAEGKLALKELRLHKRQLGLLKRTVTKNQQAIRAEYTDKVRQRMPMFRGGREIGQAIRLFQTFSRAGDRHNLASDLAPLERDKQSIDAMKLAIDHVILQVEARMHIMRNE